MYSSGVTTPLSSAAMTSSSSVSRCCKVLSNPIFLFILMSCSLPMKFVRLTIANGMSIVAINLPQIECGVTSP